MFEGRIKSIKGPEVTLDRTFCQFLNVISGSGHLPYWYIPGAGCTNPR